MFSGAVARLYSRALAVQQQLRTSERLRVGASGGTSLCGQSPPCEASAAAVSETPEPTEWRVIDHCSAVTRLYALYEQFAHEMLREHLSLLEKRRLYTELPVAFQNAYRAGVSKILEKKDGPRYQEISLTNLLLEFHKAASGQPDYRLEPLALLVHEHNLRLPALGSLYQNCGIENLAGWISSHPDMRKFFEQDRMHASAENELKALIQYRNDAAHGGLTLDDVLSVDALCEFADFIIVLCSVMSERVQHVALLDGFASGHATECGQVSEVFKGGTVAVAKVVGKFAVGDSIYLSSDTRCVERRINSMQVDGVDTAEFHAMEERELGFGLDGRAKIGVKVLRLVTQEGVATSSDDSAENELETAPKTPTDNSETSNETEEVME